MTYAIIGIAAAVIVAIAYLLIRSAVAAAVARGAAEAKQAASEEARKAEQEMTDIVLKPREPGETEKRLEDGTF